MGKFVHDVGNNGIEKESNDELTNYFENGTKLRVI